MNAVAAAPLCAKFVGPFGWTTQEGVPSIFETMEGKKRGLYVWTVAAGPAERVYYVGETSRSFAQRHLVELELPRFRGQVSAWDSSGFWGGIGVLGGG